MAEYIERKKLEEVFDNADPDICESYPDGYSDWGFGRENVRDVIRSVPKADVAPVVHGRWNSMDGYKMRVVCSVCGWDVPEYGKFYSYCPNCGAKMDGGDGDAAD